LFALNACSNSRQTTHSSIFEDELKTTESENDVERISCSDGTRLNECSEKKPLFCSKGILKELPSLCGCPEGFLLRDDECYSLYNYTNYPEFHEFMFTRNLKIGSREKINFTTYKEVNDYLAGLPRNIWYYPDKEPEPTEKDFVLKNIDDDIQAEFLYPLVEKIEELSSDKDEQARIAISIVQMIPYDYSSIINNKYAYEVLHTNKGVCGEKSELIIYLLRELGFGTAYMFFEEEKHAAAGIKCPIEYSYKNCGYCFIEATESSLIGQSNNQYVDIGRLSYNPIIYQISDGLEYQDIITQIEQAKSELENETRYQITDPSGAIILRKKGTYTDVINYPDIIIKYPN